MYLVTLCEVCFILNRDIHTVSQANAGEILNKKNDWPHLINSAICPTINEAAEIIAEDLIKLYFNPINPKGSSSLIPLESVFITLNYEKIQNKRCLVPIILRTKKTFNLNSFKLNKTLFQYQEKSP